VALAFSAALPKRKPELSGAAATVPVVP
jgi:hypothetical protein